MRRLDEAAERVGIPRVLLMENAGAAVARRVIQRFGARKVLVLAGTGNNGGDGMVAARHLSNLGCEVSVVLVGEPSAIRTQEARLNWEILSRLERVRTSVFKNLDEITRAIDQSELILDAMLGTGVRGELREPFLSIVRKVNSSGKPVVAVDSPTGLDPTSGQVCGEAIRATMTITFHSPKSGLPLVKDYTGELLVEDIGIPHELERREIGREVEHTKPEAPVLVSACLLGVNCRYDGGNCYEEKVLRHVRGRLVIPVCPEQLGGLPTPRRPNRLLGPGSEVLAGRARVVNDLGKDVTENFVRGAQEVLSIAKLFNVREAILKSGSPSCGVGRVKLPDGSWLRGDGVAAACLKKEGLRLITEHEISGF